MKSKIHEHQKNNKISVSKTLKTAFVFLLLTFTFSCSKDDEPTTTPVPEIRENRLIKEINDKTTKTFIYNSDKQLIKVIEIGDLNSGITQSIKNYTYIEGKITNKTEDFTGSQSFSFIYNYYYTNQKLASVYVQKRINGINYDFQTLTYNYETPNVIKQTDERLNGDKTLAVIDVINENITSVSYYTNVTFSNPAGILNNTNIYSNYDDKKSPYDYFTTKTLYNFPFSSNNNEGRYESSGVNINYTYEYNSDGYPISKKSSFDNKITTYQYERL